MFESRHLKLSGPSRALVLQILLLLVPLCSYGEIPGGAAVKSMDECARMLDPDAQDFAAIFNPNTPTVVIVDGYSSGRLFARAFRRAGLQVVHVHTNGSPPEHFIDSFWPGSYEKSFAYRGNFRRLIRQLADINVIAVLPGTDTGVLFADRISVAMHRRDSTIPTNGIQEGRKDKFEMQELIAKAGLQSIRQLLTLDSAESIRWLNEHGLLGETPSAVIKPLMSAGGEGVFFPRTEAEVRRIFRRSLDQRDGLGNIKGSLLTQELIRGTEYVVNTTSWTDTRGPGPAKVRRRVTEIWQYNKRMTKTGRWIYDYDLLLPFNGEIQRQLIEYDEKVLTALGINYGNSHSEIMMTDRGPILIETNIRPMGSSQPAFARFATGLSQIEATTMALTNPAAFFKLSNGYKIKKNAIVFTIANLYGRQMRLTKDIREKLRDLPGYFQDFLHVEPGTVMKPTIDMFNQVGEVWLLHDDLDTLMRTVDQLHEMERNGAFFSSR